MENETPALKGSDLTGQRFGHWLVVGRTRDSRGAKWLCRCNCGTERLIETNRLRTRTRSCGCVRPSTWSPKRKRFLHDLEGRRFGSLLVLHFVGERRSPAGSKATWLCRCDCGTERVFDARTLVTGSGTSCGKGPCHHNWKGGRQMGSGGYIYVRATEHPNANADGYIAEHRVVMEQAIGRPLKRSETVHHKNGIRDDNRIENLELWDGHHGPGQRVADRIAEYVKYLESHGYTCTPPEHPKK